MSLVLIKKLGISLLNTIYPARCISCLGITNEQNGLCDKCWMDISFTSDPMCASCGMSFEWQMRGCLCGECISTPPYYTIARHVFAYEDIGRSLIHKLKYSDQTWLAPTLASLMYNYLHKYIEDADNIIPVPMYKKNIRKRMFNQATLLARQVSKLSRTPLLLFCLIKQKQTKPQFTSTMKQRIQNVKGAYTVPKNKSYQIKGKIIILIDDVMTTGATASACSKALLKAGAKEVRVLTLASTAKNKDSK